jgi:carotenoid cleavage dioxygenase
MMHDAAITAEHIVLFDSPIVFDARAIASGGSPWRWSDRHGARFGVIRRDDLHGDIRWIEVEPVHVSHVANAHVGEDGRIVVTGTRLPRDRDAPDFGFGAGLPAMHRWVLDPQTGGATEEAIDDRSVEYPRIADQRTGLEQRWTFVASFSMDARPERSEILRYDSRDGSVASHRFAPGRTCGEPVVVHPPGTDGEDAGVVLALVHDRSTDTSSVVVLEAHDPTAPPIAEVHLPVRVPNGFHGSWLAGVSLG